MDSRTPDSTLYSGKVIEVRLETVTFPDGRSFPLEVVRHPGGAAVVALDGEGRVCLVHQYRHVTDGFMWELPAGRRTPGEDPANTVKRELREEGGAEARSWESLGSLASSPGVFSEIIFLFLARDLTLVGRELEDEEFMETHWVPLEEALAWAADGRISDAKTLAGLFRAREALRDSAG
ncbi:MAG: NUDIX hydrolase [Pseudomonadota bacterium]|nr:NUDIX hydrolase [Pseudomonadota bacterium]